MRDLLAFVKSFGCLETRAQDAHFHVLLELVLMSFVSCLNQISGTLLLA